MRALIVVLFALACWWPTRDLPWARMDAPKFVQVDRALAPLSLAAQVPVALEVGPVIGSKYGGMYNPVIWIANGVCARAVGWDLRAHRLLRLAAFVLLAWWVMAFAARVTRSRGLGLAAALGFLAFPSHMECWTLLPVFEPIQALCLAACVASLWIWALPRRPAAWLALAFVSAALAVWSKSTSWCLVLPVALFTGWAFSAARGRERRRLLAGLACLWVGLSLLLGLYVRAGGGRRQAGTWVANYRIEAREIAIVCAYDLDELWRATALLVPLAALGFAFERPAWRSRRALALLLCAGWACGAFLIFLPWTAPSSRYWLAGSAPFAVVVAAGVRGAWTAWPLRALAVACLAWMVFQFDYRRDAQMMLDAACDGAVLEVVDELARRAPQGATIAHPCPSHGTCDLFRCVAEHLAMFGGRTDLKFNCTAIPERGGEPDAVVVTPREPEAQVAGAPAFEVISHPWHREPPDPRYALWCLRTGQPVGGPGWKEEWRWRVYLTPSSPRASPARP